MNKNKSKSKTASKKPVKAQMNHQTGMVKPRKKMGKRGQSKNLNGALYNRDGFHKGKIAEAADKVFGG